MPPLDLASLDSLRQLEADYRAARADPSSIYFGWCQSLTAYLDRVAKASVEERASLEFQKRLWEENPIADAGQGTVSVARALAEESFRRWLAERSCAPLPSERAEAINVLRALYAEILERLKSWSDRAPRLKTFRVLAALFPHHFTTIADISRLSQLHQAMLDGRKADEVEAHVNVLARLTEALGPAPSDMRGWVERMTLPWFIFERIERARKEASAPAPLQPLVANRRRRGMTAIKGSLDGVLRVLDFVKDGATRDDLVTFIKQESPTLKKNSLSTNIYVLRSELGVLEERNGQFFPTDAGRQLLETEDATVLSPWLLTTILGVDHVLVHLREQGSATTKELLEKLKGVNPGWTSNYAPKSILTWLRSFDALELGVDSRMRLTSRGKEWAARVHWTPEVLGRDPVDDGLDGDEEEPPKPPPPAGVDVPLLEDILAALPKDVTFPKEKVAVLHAGLWAHPRRHFALLTGLSGSGKTSLARAYATALIAPSGGTEVGKPRLLTVPVQPAWSDPSAILGYPHPLRPEEYVRTDFLDVLRACEAHPSAVHVVVLDEMNLSHPEQYLAPILSAMETGDPIVLHRQPDTLEDTPPEIRSYPSNLVIIGTVNMDETTHGLSDKVLDRAVVLDFWEIDLDDYPRWGKRGIAPAEEMRVHELLGELIEVLKPVRLHFGWRVVDEVLDFLDRASKDGHLELTVALDWIIHAKVLPKLRGHDSPRFLTAFEACRDVLGKAGLQRSKAKAEELLEDLKTTGSARFWR